MTRFAQVSHQPGTPEDATALGVDPLDVNSKAKNAFAFHQDSALHFERGILGARLG